MPAFKIKTLDGFGQLTGQQTINKFGRNPDVDAAAAEDIWDGGAVWVAPTTNRIHNIVSDDANDTSAGSGCRGITVQGLSSGVLTEENITMAGATPVATTNSYEIIHRMFATAGLGSGSNVGTITATAVTDATVTAQINPTNNQTLMAIYKIPDTYTGYMLNYYASANKGTGATVTVNSLLLAEEEDGPLRVKHVLGLVVAGTSYLNHKFSVPRSFNAGSTVRIRADTSANDTDVSAGFDLVLVKNG